MKEYFQNLLQMLMITFHVWFKPHALNLDKPVYSFGLGDEFNEEIDNEEFDLIELENNLNSTMQIQKNSIFCVEIQGTILPIFLN
jgi:hypothetical protein